MSIDKISEWNNQVYQRSEIKKADQRHNDAVVEQRQTKARREADELKRIEMNRYLNRPGQNVDRMAQIGSANFAEISKKIQPWGFSHVNIYMNESTQFTIADLAGVRNIIDLACQRGAFRGEEMKDVGLIFERLTNFIIQTQEAVEAQAQAPDAEQQPAELATPIQGE